MLNRRLLLLLLLIITACKDATAAPPLPEPTIAATALPPAPSAKGLPSASPSATPRSPETMTTASPQAATVTGTARPTAAAPTAAAPTATVDPYSQFTVDALAGRSYGGGELAIVDTLRDEDDEEMARYLIRYPSDGLDIYGFLSVPNEGTKFPVAIVLHGYIPPNEYDVETYTVRYADALTAAGYFVIHPNFRNYPPSDSGANLFRVGYAIDILNLIAIVRELSLDPNGPLRRADGGQIHLMGHSMGGGVALRVSVVWPEAISAVVLYGSMSGDEVKNFERIREWTESQRGSFELHAPVAMQQAISPIYHLDRLQTPLSIHHSADDTVVPIAWSDELCGLLQGLNRPVECFTYYGVPHTFRGGADELFMTRMIAFFDRY